MTRQGTRVAAKKFLFILDIPLRGEEGGKGLSTEKKDFLKRFFLFFSIFVEVLLTTRGRGLKASVYCKLKKRDSFYGFPFSWLAIDMEDMQKNKDESSIGSSGTLVPVVKVSMN